MKIQENVQLAPLTSFDVGGPAENLLTIESSHELAQALTHASGHETWMLGYGTNVLISDQGLDGYTLLFRNKNIEWQTNTVIVDAGVWWDDLVQQAIQRGFWGLELMSGVPGSVGAAIFINITAYGQSLSDKLVWVDYMDKNGRTERLDARSQSWGYKQSVFQQHQDWFIVKAAFELDTENRVELAYQSALDVAKDLNLSTDNLTNRRQIILEARDRAGSIFVPGQNYAKTVGSFFRNPMVTPAQAEEVAKFDETGKTKQQIMSMNKVHGGDQARVSAAHVMLAAGFKRGQSWGGVRLHPSNLLKIENTGGASAQQIYDVAEEIIRTVKQKLDINLEPEARILGKFN